MEVRQIISSTIVSLLISSPVFANMTTIVGKVQRANVEPNCAFNDDNTQVVGLKNCPPTADIVMLIEGAGEFYLFKVKLQDLQSINDKKCTVTFDGFIPVNFGLGTLKIYQTQSIKCD